MSSSESPLWYQLYIGQEQEGQEVEIDTNGLMYLVDVREAIFNKYEATLRHHLEHICDSHLYIYPPNTKIPDISDETESYSPRMKLSKLKEEVGEEDTLVVVAKAKDSGVLSSSSDYRPTKKQRAESYGNNTLSSVLEESGRIVFVDRTASRVHEATSDPAGISPHILDLQNDLTEYENNQLLMAPYINPMNHTPSGPVLSINSEADVVNQCVSLIESVIQSLKLNKVIYVSIGRTVAGIECDIVLLYGAHSIPFAAIEVKKPGFDVEGNYERSYTVDRSYQFRGPAEKYIFSGDEDLLEEDYIAGKVAGQNLDQLNALELGGYCNLVGMITSGNTWMLTQNIQNDDDFVDFQSIKNVPQNNNISNVGTDTGAKTPSPKKLFENHQEEVGNSEGETGNQEQLRVLKVSQPVSLSSSPQECLHLLNQFVLRAYTRILPQNKIPLHRVATSTRSCRVLQIHPNNHPNNSTRMNQNSLAFQRVEIDNCGFDLSKSTEVNNKTMKLYVIKNIGAGDSGDCCLAMTTGKENNQNTEKAYSAVKFFRFDESFEITNNRAREEYENWCSIYPNLKKYIHLGQSGNLPFLVMPYLAPIKGEQNVPLVRHCIQEFRTKGYVHKEIYWHHFGKFGDKVYMLDLGTNGVERVNGKSNEEEIDNYVAESIQNLVKRLHDKSSTELQNDHDMI